MLAHIVIYDAIRLAIFSPVSPSDIYIFNDSWLVRMSEILLATILKVAGS